MYFAYRNFKDTLVRIFYSQLRICTAFWVRLQSAAYKPPCSAMWARYKKKFTNKQGRLAEDDGSLGLQSVVENESESATSDSAGQHIDGGNEDSD